MKTIAQLIEELAQKHNELAQKKAASSDVAEALALSAEYHALVAELAQRCTPPAYPVYNYPYNWWYSGAWIVPPITTVAAHIPLTTGATYPYTIGTISNPTTV